jgi:muramidase (phage lysozyme)
MTQDKRYTIFINNIRKYQPITQAEETQLKRLFYTHYNVIEKSHIPHEYIWYIAFRESRLNRKATNAQSSAKGMFQFINGTWEAMCKRKGMDISGRYEEKKQVLVMVEYINYLYLKHKNWYKLFQEYAGSINPPYTIPNFNI